MSSIKFNELTPKKVLGVAAHPDDLDFGASGSMAKWAKSGAEVYYLILTDGSKGSDDINITPEALVEIRQNEQRTAAQAIGAKDVIFFNYPDAYLEVTLELKKDITRIIRKLKPDVVITMDPNLIYDSTRGFINHSDHRAAGQATLDAVFPMARDRLTFPDLLEDGYEPHKVPTLLLVNFTHGNYFEDITDTIDAKMSALAAHDSQMDDVPGTQNRLKQMAKDNGEKLSLIHI